MGVSMGQGASQTLFGAAGPATILTKITTAVAIIFMLTSLSLAYVSGHRNETSIMKQVKLPTAATQKVEPQAPATSREQGGKATEQAE